MKAGHTHYTAGSGIPELRSRRRALVSRRLTASSTRPSRSSFPTAPSIRFTTRLAATVGPGDEVIIPTPYWVSYSDLVQMTGATPVLVPTTQRSRLQDDARPTSRRRHAAQQAGDAQLALQPDRHRLHAARARSPRRRRPGDEARCYQRRDLRKAHLRHARATCFATLRPELAERTITISGASKSYAMTGWRMGWSLGPTPVIKAMGNVQSQQTGNPSSISQYAALAALEGDQACVEHMRQEFEARRDLVLRSAGENPGNPLVGAGWRVLRFLRCVRSFRPADRRTDR